MTNGIFLAILAIDSYTASAGDISLRGLNLNVQAGGAVGGTGVIYTHCRRVLTLAILIVMLCVTEIGLFPREASAALKFFQFFGRICITVYNLQENHRP